MSVRMLHLHNETNASCPDLRGQGYRACFHTHSSARGPRKKIYHGHLDGKGPRRGEHAVVKVFRDCPGTETMCDVEIAKHKLALRLAKKFNKMVPNEEYHIHFTLPLKSTVERLGMGVFFTRHKARHIDTKEWVLIEENLIMQGDYQVFIKKTGERLGNDPTSLDAFLHYTYHESGGLFLMCGFQGVEGKKGYLLTTPCIHSQDESYGAPTDKGPSAMKKVFQNHRCNNLCYSFIRPDLNNLTLEDKSLEDDIDNTEIQEEGDTGAEEEGVPEDVPSLNVTNGHTDGETRKQKDRKKLRLLPSFKHKRDKKKDKSEQPVHGSNVQVVGAIRKRPSI